MFEEFVFRGFGISVLLVGLVAGVSGWLTKRKEKKLLNVMYSMKSDKLDPNGSDDNQSYISDAIMIAKKSDLECQRNSGNAPDHKNYPSIHLVNYSRNVELISTTKTIW